MAIGGGHYLRCRKTARMWQDISRKLTRVSRWDIRVPQSAVSSRRKPECSARTQGGTGSLIDQGDGRAPSVRSDASEHWIPAFAGMTTVVVAAGGDGKARSA